MKIQNPLSFFFITILWMDNTSVLYQFIEYIWSPQPMNGIAVGLAIGMKVGKEDK